MTTETEREKRLRERAEKRRRQVLIMRILIAVLAVVLVLCIIILIRAALNDGARKKGNRKAENTAAAGQEAAGTADAPAAGQDAADAQADAADQTADSGDAAGSGQDSGAGAENGTSAQEDVLSKADLMAAQYDYDGAVSLLKSQPDYEQNTQYQEAASGYETKKSGCSAFPLDQVTHIFFHTLIRDTSKAFDGDSKEGGYNQVMTTIKEFNSIIDQMYERGFVMVSLHDMCEVAEDGSVTPKEILLPEGKKPFVLSQDDVSYYHYMDGDGFAEKLIVDNNGEVKNTYIEDDGTVSVGDYDMVPLIDTFVKEHPDFAYHGHKGIIALTGYEGVLGYRTDEVYLTRQADRVTDFQQAFFDSHPDFDYDAEVAQATEVANAMKANGWEFASHTWGHIDPRKYGYDSTVRDTQRFLDYVVPVIGPTDVLIFAFGADINDWTPYTSDNEFFTYLKGAGFNIFCNVDSNPYWVQFGSNYMRQGRRNLDGYRMYYTPELCTDLFDVETAWDDARPTPVPPI